MDLFFRAVSRLVRFASLGLVATLMVACGGGDDSDDSTDPPSITAQPLDDTVTAGQSAVFTVDVDGAEPLSYQWQRNGVDLPGETDATYIISSTPAGDDGATYSVVVSNDEGSVTSEEAVLTVNVPTPVLKVTQQPANVTVAAGTAASFSVAATCSSGALDVQWQRNNGVNAAFAPIAGASAANLALVTSDADNGALLRAALDCGGLSAATSATATLTVSP